jgi:hypothetical protein
VADLLNGDAQRPSRKTETIGQLCGYVIPDQLILSSAHSVLFLTDLDDPCAAFSAPSAHDWMHAGAAHAGNI